MRKRNCVKGHGTIHDHRWVVPLPIHPYPYVQRLQREALFFIREIRRHVLHGYGPGFETGRTCERLFSGSLPHTDHFSFLTPAVDGLVDDNKLAQPRLGDGMIVKIGDTLSEGRCPPFFLMKPRVQHHDVFGNRIV